jgi:uncharacterized protein YxeA
MDPVHDAEQNGGKRKDKREDRGVPRRQYQVLAFENDGDKKKYQRAYDKTYRHMRYRRMERLLKTDFCQ